MQTVAETKPTSTTIPRRWITLKIIQTTNKPWEAEHTRTTTGEINNINTRQATEGNQQKNQRHLGKPKKKKHLLEKQKEPRTNQQTPSQRINKSRRLNHQSKNTKSPRDISNNSKACKQFLFIGKPKENSNKPRDINKTPINKHRKKSNTMYISTP